MTQAGGASESTTNVFISFSSVRVQFADLRLLMVVSIIRQRDSSGKISALE